MIWYSNTQILCCNIHRNNCCILSGKYVKRGGMNENIGWIDWIVEMVPANQAITNNTAPNKMLVYCWHNSYNPVLWIFYLHRLVALLPHSVAIVVLSIMTIDDVVPLVAL